MFEGRLFLKLGFLGSWKRHSGNALPPINTVQIQKVVSIEENHENWREDGREEEEIAFSSTNSYDLITRPAASYLSQSW
jgi:hypothetical protein